MSYWIYENWTADDKAVIHNGACGFCNHGKGSSKPHPHGNKNGKWHGPFNTIAAAERVAKATKRAVQKKHACI
jgi:hypothetical protein